MKKITYILVLLGLNLSVFAQLQTTHLHGKSSIGVNDKLLHGNLIIESNGELFLGCHDSPLQKTNRLYKVGHFEGKTGAKLHLSITDNSNTSGTRGFFEIVGTANGTTEIVLDMFNNWDGSRIDLARAYNTGSNPQAFTMQENTYNGILAELRSRIEGSDRIWFIAPKGECLPTILQKKNNTLVVDNNPTTNGGFDFVHYKWYKNDILIHEGDWGIGQGGLYNTGRSNLNPIDTYHVLLTDHLGNEHRTCPFNPTIFVLATKLSAYPNPVTADQPLVVVEVETNDEDLLTNGTITTYNLSGQLIGQKRTNGHRVTPVQLPAVAGTYLLRFVSGDYTETIRIIVTQ
jgi:hypothetical protein